MCGRGVLATKPEDLRQALGLDDLPELSPRYNVAPTQPIAIVRQPRKLELLRWGLIPHGSHTLSAGARGINVRVETVARAPAYRSSFRSRRCLVVLDAFYEWQRRDKKKQPFLVRRPDGAPLVLGGIWDRAVTGDGEVVESCAIITRPAAGIVATLHDRMPLLLSPDQYASWLDPSARDATSLLAGADVELAAFPVRTLVNDPKHEGPELIEPTPDEDGASGETH
jgi:putative SOS response-associated peptidase YedK